MAGKRGEGGSQTAERVEAVQEGSRWLHNPPDGPTFAAWFKANVNLHDGLKHEDYLNGITLIPNKETHRETRLDSSGSPQIVEVERLVFSPYPQVETRVQYFWDYCRRNGLLGEIEILPVPRQNPTLPDGIFHTTVKHAGKEVIWLGAKAKVRTFERDVRSGDRGRLTISAPKATKTVPMNSPRYGPDVNAPLKAETGAIGRALGFAGMLVIPGAGISTAEDMLDLASGSQPVAGTEPTLPEQTPATIGEAEPAAQDAETLAKLVEEHIAELRKHPKEWGEFEAWANERDLPLENTPPAALRPLEAQLRRKLDQVKPGS